MRFVVLLGFFLCAAVPARADYVSCSTAQVTRLQKALLNARNAVSEATIAIAPDNSVYERWFGQWNSGRAADVHRSLAAIKRTLDDTVLTVHCMAAGAGSCQGGVYAYVDRHEAFNIYMCRLSFQMPQLSGDKREAGDSATGTLAGTLVHELSHFAVVANTDDHAYTQDACMQMARQSPQLAVRNADSYQYFVENAFLKMQ
jgi:peptidyl-Lys metalloendopeptidase